MPISRWWLQAALLTYLVGFLLLGILAWRTYAEQPPLPGRVTDPRGTLLYTRDDVLAGQHVFQRYGLMEYGSIYGHGAYLGPDFTADYLERSALVLRDSGLTPEAIAKELHENRYDAATDSLVLSEARARAHRRLIARYAALFTAPAAHFGAQSRWIDDPEALRQLTAFFGWTAWTATANRPGLDHSYTNNWPPDPLAGNHLTSASILWSAVSIVGLLAGMGLVLFFFGRYDWLGWNERVQAVRFRRPGEVALTPSQRAIMWFVVVAMVLFFVQTALGGLCAHYRSEPSSLFSRVTSTWLPYNIARIWHLQLSLFWVVASFLAIGIFLVPFIAGREPRGQAGLAYGLLGALVVVIAGSFIGEYASVRGYLRRGWFWLGDQGWEYLDLGRLWQLALIVGLALWAFILWRGLRHRLRHEAHGNLPWMLFYAALAIPAFYAVGLLARSEETFVVTDFWRFWVVHLWVEDFLELFTTIIVAWCFVLLGLVRERTAIRVIYLDVILYSVGGVVGTMHHLYFSGTPAVHLALGATFSALEVIPLLLLTLEAWAFMRSGERSMLGGGAGDREHPHKWAVWFLVSVGAWNFLGAGVFGFLINLPMVSYYEIGTYLTANHAHTAMMGVYGMLAVGLCLVCLRYRVREDRWSDRAAKISFWSLNLGLVWMAFANLFPVGIAQFWDALEKGYFYARSTDFHAQGWVRVLEWMRLPGDLLFILGGTLPLLYLCWLAVRYPNPLHAEADEEVPTRLAYVPDEDPDGP